MNITKPLSIFTESAYFRYFIPGVIILSAVIIGIETYPDTYRQHYNLLHLLDRMILARGIRPGDYFKDPWNVFDFIVVAVCFIPAIGTHYVAVLRLARILSVFRVISIFPKLQLLVGALLIASLRWAISFSSWRLLKYKTSETSDVKAMIAILIKRSTI